MSKHTPGPWSYLHPVGSDNFLVHAFDSHFTHALIRVALVPNKVYTHTHGWPEHNERHANAHLIAAAPQMLEGLKKAKWMLERDYIDKQKMAVIEDLDAIIESAEGEKK